MTVDAPRECKLCKHSYWKPCDGEKADCPNRAPAEAAKRLLSMQEAEQK